MSRDPTEIERNLSMRMNRFREERDTLRARVQELEREVDDQDDEVTKLKWRVERLVTTNQSKAKALQLLDETTEQMEEALGTDCDDDPITDERTRTNRAFLARHETGSESNDG